MAVMEVNFKNDALSERWHSMLFYCLANCVCKPQLPGEPLLLLPKYSYWYYTGYNSLVSLGLHLASAPRKSITSSDCTSLSKIRDVWVGRDWQLSSFWNWYLMCKNVTLTLIVRHLLLSSPSHTFLRGQSVLLRRLEYKVADWDHF